MEQMENLIYFEGGENLVFKIPEPRSDADAWTRGTNSAGGSLRSMRIVMPLGMARDILQKSDLHIFQQAGAVECWPEELTSPKQEVRFLNRTTMKKVECPRAGDAGDRCAARST